MATKSVGDTLSGSEHRTFLKRELAGSTWTARLLMGRMSTAAVVSAPEATIVVIFFFVGGYLGRRP